MNDYLHLVDNPDIQKGISLQGISWAMTTFYTTNWHPLTWISLMADYDLYGLTPAGYHFSNLLLHLLNTLFLFLVLRRMTGEKWKCLAVAALFAVHPLNIESVAWVAERKNLLSSLFLILTLFAYACYVERPGWWRYLMAMFLFALGLMAKPMLVTLPLMLLLLDYWPLKRLLPIIRGQSGSSVPVSRGAVLRSLLKEKTPFFILSLCSVLITLYAAKMGGALRSIEDLPLSERIGNALIAYVSYLDKMIWPVKLAIFYPYPANRPAWQFATALFLLIAITVFVTLKGRKHPYLVTGWFWYLVTLLPVIGIIQVGFQSMANRYAYVPLMGLFLIITWGSAEFLKTHTGNNRYLPVALILIFSFSTWAQLPYWRNSEAAFKHAIRVTENNFIALCGMGDVWQNRGDFQTARLYYQETLRIKPNYAEAHNNLALILIREGRVVDAEAGFREALKYKPGLAEAHNNLGAALTSQNKLQEASAHFIRALELRPGYTTAQGNLERITKGGLP